MNRRSLIALKTNLIWLIIMHANSKFVTQLIVAQNSQSQIKSAGIARRINVIELIGLFVVVFFFLRIFDFASKQVRRICHLCVLFYNYILL